MRERLDTDFDINFLVFCCSSCTCLFTKFVFKASWWVREPFLELISKWGRKFRSSSHPRGWCSTRRIPLPTDSFFAFYPALTRIVFSVWVFFSQSKPAADFSWYISIFNKGACCYDNLDFGNLPSLFPICFSFFIYVFSSPLSYSRPVNLAWKQVTIPESLIILQSHTLNPPGWSQIKILKNIDKNSIEFLDPFCFFSLNLPDWLLQQLRLEAAADFW